jgi:hypothetical protein
MGYGSWICFLKVYPNKFKKRRVDINTMTERSTGFCAKNVNLSERVVLLCRVLNFEYADFSIYSIY